MDIFSKCELPPEKTSNYRRNDTFRGTSVLQDFDREMVSRPQGEKIDCSWKSDVKKTNDLNLAKYSQVQVLLLSQYIREAYGHEERKGHPQIAWKLKETIETLDFSISIHIILLQ